MNTLEIIPIKNQIEASLQLAKDYHACFEYNDFFIPDVLDSPKLLDELIDFYKNLPRDRSNDTMHGVFLDITVHSSDSLIREVSIKRIHQSMEIASRLGIRGVIFHTNLLATFQSKAYLENWQKSNQTFFAKLSMEYPHLQIYMENMFDLIPDVHADFGRAMEKYPNIHLCLDIAHAHLSKESVSSWIKADIPYIGHIHINDNDGLEDIHDTIGNGTIDWQLYDRLMRSFHTNTSVLVEISSLEKQRASLAYMKEHHIFPFS